MTPNNPVHADRAPRALVARAATRSVVVAVLATVLATALDGRASAQVVDTAAIEKLVDRAKTTLQRGDTEECARLARIARSEMAAWPEGGRVAELDLAVAELIGKTDPRDADRQKAIESACRELIGVAEQYQKAGRHRIALALLRQVEALDPTLARTPLEASRAAVDASAGPAAAAGELGELFSDGIVVWGAEEWRMADGILDSPALTIKQSCLIVSNARVSLSGTGSGSGASVEVSTGDRELAVDLMCGYLHFDENVGVRLLRDPTRSYLRLFRTHGGQRHFLATKAIELPPAQRKGWMRLSLQIRNGKLSARIGDQKPIEATLGLAELPGFLGFYAYTPTAEGAVVRFRNLAVDRPGG